jgi:hypothetical protein
MGEPIYLLDANVFIEAKNRYYAFDLAPKFWESLEEQGGKGRILSIDRVKKELERGKDELATWTKGQFSHGFVSTDEAEITQVYGSIMIWVNNQKQFTEPAKAEFATGADGWLIAYAKAKNCVVVTHEVFALDVKRKVPIPNICKAFDVPCVDTFEMLRKLGVRFG